MQNLTVGSTIYWPSIAGNLSVVSILLSNVKSHRYFNAFLALYCRQSIRFFFSFLSQLENQTVVSTMFWPWIAGNLSVVSIPLSHGKSNRSFNNVSASSCGQSIRRFNSFLKGKI